MDETVSNLNVLLDAIAHNLVGQHVDSLDQNSRTVFRLLHEADRLLLTETRYITTPDTMPGFRVIRYDTRKILKTFPPSENMDGMEYNNARKWLLENLKAGGELEGFTENEVGVV